MRRGELYIYVRPATPTNRRTVLVLSGNDVIRPTRPWVLGLEVRSDDPEDLLAVPSATGGSPTSAISAGCIARGSVDVPVGSIR